MRIYLDFDGVLHGTVAKMGGGVFEHMDAFADFLRRYPDIEVVITSSWREHFALSDLRGFFAEDLAHRVIGVTPVLYSQSRFEEIQAHLERTRYAGPFVVLDDDASQFPEGYPFLYQTHGNSGLRPEDYGAIAELLGVQPQD